MQSKKKGAKQHKAQFERPWLRPQGIRLSTRKHQSKPKFLATCSRNCENAVCGVKPWTKKDADFPGHLNLLAIPATKININHKVAALRRSNSRYPSSPSGGSCHWQLPDWNTRTAPYVRRSKRIYEGTRLQNKHNNDHTKVPILILMWGP